MNGFLPGVAFRFNPFPPFPVSMETGHSPLGRLVVNLKGLNVREPSASSSDLNEGGMFRTETCWFGIHTESSMELVLREQEFGDILRVTWHCACGEGV